MGPQITDKNQSVTQTTEPWHAPLNRVTTVSKILAAVVFITLPFVGFWLGMGYGEVENSQSPEFINHSVEVPVADGIVSQEETKQKVYTADDFKWHVVAQVYSDASVGIPYGKVVLEAGGEQWSLGDYAGCSSSPTLTDLSEGEITRLVCWYASGGNELSVFYDKPTDSYVVKVRDVNESGGPGNPNPPERYGEYKNKIIIDPARLLSKTAEQDAKVVMAGEEAKKLSSSDLETQLISGLTSLSSKYDVSLGLKMSGFLREYSSVRNLTNPQIDQLQNQLNDTLGPCWGIPEGQCRE